MQSITQTRCSKPVGRGQCTHDAAIIIDGQGYCEIHAPAVEAVEEPAVEPVEMPVADETTFKRCACGCGSIVHKKRSYLQGHDARHKSRLLKAALAGDEVAAVELINRGWYSNDEIAARMEAAEATRQKREAKAATNAQAG